MFLNVSSSIISIPRFKALLYLDPGLSPCNKKSVDGFLALFLSIGFIIANFLASPSNPDPEKLSAYECGFEAFDDSRMEFDVRFYLVAILFIIFDLEIAFLFPRAIS